MKVGFGALIRFPAPTPGALVVFGAFWRTFSAINTTEKGVITMVDTLASTSGGSLSLIPAPACDYRKGTGRRSRQH